MSMINDALRRASGNVKSGGSTSPLPPMPVPPLPGEHVSAPPPPPPIPVAIPPMPESLSMSVMTAPPPLLQPQPTKRGAKLVLVLVILIVLGLGAAGGFLFWQKSRAALAKNNSDVKEEIIDNDRLAALFGDEKAATKIARADLRTNSVAVSPARAARPPQPAAAPPVPVTVTAIQPAPAHAPVPQAPVRFPPLRLQSIFYRPSNPSVIINGKTLFVTDEINGVTVADIQSSSVTLVLSGQTNILTLR